jgi:hypothetical protein
MAGRLATTDTARLIALAAGYGVFLWPPFLLGRGHSFRAEAVGFGWAIASAKPGHPLASGGQTVASG